MTRNKSSGRLWGLSRPVLPVLVSVCMYSMAISFMAVSLTAISLAARADDVLSSCQLPGIAEKAKCGVVEVPENPLKPDGRKLGISVAVLPATQGPALPDPILILMGGPGEDAISAAADFAGVLAAVRRDRDVLLIDQRGTGKSARLGCDPVLDRKSVV